ncbi:MAG: hypothetical protein R3C19_01800 [Planctomycetaceae bacterium]
MRATISRTRSRKAPGPVSVTDSDATLSDVDNTTYLGLGLNLAGFVDGTSERVTIDGVTFAFGTGLTTTTTVGSTTFELDFDGSGFTIANNAGGAAPQADLEALIRTVQYENTSLNPTAGNRQLNFIPQDAGGLNGATAVSTITVSGTNTAPTLTAFSAPVDTTLEDAEVEVTSAELAAQGDETDVDGTVIAFVVKSVSSGTLKIGTSAGTATAWAAGTNDTIDASNNAYWTPAASANGTLTAFSVVAKDDGGLESSSAVTVQVDVTAVNDAPSGADNTVATVRDQDYVFSTGDFGFSDVDGDNLQSVILTTFASNGTLFVDVNDDGVIDAGEALTIGQAVTAPIIQAGQLKFRPVAGASGIGYDSFSFQVRDDGGTANGGVDIDPTPNTMTIDVNDAHRIEGNIFEDVNGDAQLGDAVLLSNVTVYLYQDVDNDDAISAADTLVASTTTDVNGFYRFNSLADDTYFVVVDSRTIAPGAGLNATFAPTDIWAEQTYGVAGAASGADFLGSSGALFGGRTADVSDDASSLMTAEHVTRVGVNGSDVGNIDAGFSFNVVTGVRDGDDVGGENRSVQGSLRQFVTNANAIVGANVMRFVPGVATNTSDGSGNDWWSIQLTSSLNPLNDTGTVIDGTAYDAADGATVLNSNAGQIGSGGTVGLGADGVLGTGDDVTITQFERTELEVVGAATSTRVIVANGDDFELRDLALRKLSDGSTTSALAGIYGANSTIADSLFGVSADGTKYGDTGTNATFLALNSVNGGTVQHNYFGYGGSDVVNVLGTTDSTGVNIIGNEADGQFKFGISAYGDNLLVSGNLVHGVMNGFGIGTFYGPYTNIAIENNTVRDTTGYAAIAAGFGSNDVTVRYNIVHDNLFGIHARGDGASGYDDANNAVFSMNSVYNNGDGGLDVFETDVNDGLLDPTAPNEGIDHPIVTMANLVGGNLTLAGYVGAAPGDTDFANARIEFFVSDGSGEGQTYIGFLTTDATGRFSGVLAAAGVLNTDSLVATATLAGIGTSEFGNEFAVNVGPVISVPGTQSAQEDTSLSISGLSVSDADTNVTSVQLSAGSGSLTVTLQGVASISAGINGTSTLTVNGTQVDINSTLATLSYLGNANWNGTDTISVLATDGGGLTHADSFDVSVASVNDAPVVDNGANIGYAEGSGAAAFTTKLIADVDGSDFDGGVLTVTISSGSDGSDLLTIIPNYGASVVGSNVVVGGITIGTIAGNNTNGPLTVTFNTSAYLSDVLAVYRGIAIRNVTDNPAPGARVVSVVLTDGDGGTSNTATATLTLTAVNDNPYNSGSLPANVTVTEDVATSIDLSAITLADPDANSGSLTLKLTAGAGNLTAAGGTGIIVGYNGSSAITLTGTLTDLNAYLATTTNVSYLHPTANHNGTDIIAVAINDGGNTGFGGGTDISLGTINVDITAVDDTPTVVAPIGNVTVNEDAVSTTIICRRCSATWTSPRTVIRCRSA